MRFNESLQLSADETRLMGLVLSIALEKAVRELGRFCRRSQRSA